MNDDTLSNDVFTSIRTLLVSNAHLLVPTSTSINASYNDKITSKPQIVINPASIIEEFNKFGGSEGKKSINVVLELYADNTLNLDKLRDSVLKIIKNNNLTGMSLINVEDNYDFQLISDLKFHSRTISLAYLRE